MTGALLRVARADRRTVWRWALVVIVAAAVARVGWAAWIAHAEPSAVWRTDTPGYLWPSRALVEAGRFSLSPYDPTPMYVRTPGYPAFTAPILWLTDSEWAISPVQAAVSLLAVVAIVLVGRRLVGLTAGLIAGALVALDPLQFAASGTLLTEGVASVVLAGIIAVGGVVFASRRPAAVPPVAVFALGTLAAVATMVRPVFWFYPLVLLPLLALRFRGLPWRILLARLAVFLLPLAVIVGGWQLRNHSAVGSWQVSGVSGVNLYCYYAAEVEARVAGISIDGARDRLGCPTSFANTDRLCTPSVGFGCQSPDPDADGQGFDEWRRQGLDILTNHPVQAARVAGAGVFREVAGPGREYVGRYLGTGETTPLSVVLSSWNVGLWAFAAVGVVVGLRSTKRLFWAFVIATIGYVLLFSAGTAADARFRAPLVPLLALLAALGVQRALRRFRRPRREPSPAQDESALVTVSRS